MKTPTKAKFFAINGIDESEIRADSVILQTPDGRRFELDYRVTDNEVSLSCEGSMSILPRASNVVRVDCERRL